MVKGDRVLHDFGWIGTVVFVDPLWGGRYLRVRFDPVVPGYPFTIRCCVRELSPI